MIDDSDADFSLLISSGTPGWIGLVLLVLAIVVRLVACSNDDECGKKHCPHGHPTLTAHECLCVEAAQ